VNLHEDTTRVLTNWRPRDPGQEALRQAFLGFLAALPGGCRRSCVPGHITASALVLDPAGERALLTLHPRIGRWVQLGGHCEETDATLAGAALREATEESGMDGLLIDDVPMHLDVHPITCSLGVPTRHFDVRFAVHAPAGAVPARSSESVDLRWWPLDALPETADVTELVRCARTR
jgi:8-oxo-dGTP pyrophosphatase MutT (NUDIX family)